MAGLEVTATYTSSKHLGKAKEVRNCFQLKDLTIWRKYSGYIQSFCARTGLERLVTARATLKCRGVPGAPGGMGGEMTTDGMQRTFSFSHGHLPLMKASAAQDHHVGPRSPMASGWAAGAALQMMSPESTMVLCRAGNGLLLLANLDVQQHVVPTENFGDRLE